MMIDTRELRIGNLVVIGDKVITMDVRTFHAVIHSFQGYEPEPMPLTNDWFDKFDWKDGFSKGKLIRSGLAIRLLGHDMDVKYVHKLQNLYYEVEKEELKLNDK